MFRSRPTHDDERGSALGFSTDNNKLVGPWLHRLLHGGLKYGRERCWGWQNRPIEAEAPRRCVRGMLGVGGAQPAGGFANVPEDGVELLDLNVGRGCRGRRGQHSDSIAPLGVTVRS
jgi:hypothetical protein